MRAMMAALVRSSSKNHENRNRIAASAGQADNADVVVGDHHPCASRNAPAGLVRHGDIRRQQAPEFVGTFPSRTSFQQEIAMRCSLKGAPAANIRAARQPARGPVEYWLSMAVHHPRRPRSPLRIQSGDVAVHNLGPPRNREQQVADVVVALRNAVRCSSATVDQPPRGRPRAARPRIGKRSTTNQDACHVRERPRIRGGRAAEPWNRTRRSS